MKLGVRSNFDCSPGVRGTGQKLCERRLGRGDFADRFRLRRLRELAHQFSRTPCPALCLKHPWVSLHDRRTMFASAATSEYVVERSRDRLLPARKR